jgi:putative transposon-encoded protein
MARKLVLSKEKLVLTEEIEGFIRKEIKEFGTGAMVVCPKEFIGRTAYIVVCKE